MEKVRNKLLVRVLMKVFTESQFCYCPLIWIFHSRFNHLQERSLGVVYQEITSSCEDLLKSYRSFTIHERNIQSPAIELLKVK